MVLVLQESVIVVNGLRKEYEEKKACSIFKKKKKVAVKNLSFCVKKGWSTLLCLPTNRKGQLETLFLLESPLKPNAGSTAGFMSLPTQAIL